MLVSAWSIVLLLILLFAGTIVFFGISRRRRERDRVGDEGREDMSTWEERELDAMLADMSSPGGSPRAQHYDFAHRLLRQRFLNDPRGLAHLIAGEDGGILLQAFWNEAAPATETEEQISPRGLARSIESWEGGKMVVVTLPEARAVTEAHMVALVVPATGDPRYFTLEVAYDDDMRRHTVFCEWRDGVHMNYGDGPELSHEAFASAVRLEVDPGSGN